MNGMNGMNSTNATRREEIAYAKTKCLNLARSIEYAEARLDHGDQLAVLNIERLLIELANFRAWLGRLERKEKECEGR